MLWQLTLLARDPTGRARPWRQEMRKRREEIRELELRQWKISSAMERRTRAFPAPASRLPHSAVDASARAPAWRSWLQ